jgi:hypothetical protein
METDYAGRLEDLWGDENGKNGEKQDWLAHRYGAARSTIVRAIGIVKTRH